ncbi:S8 family serine peptidase [Pseudenhygromyxa sp. WMMC2535]|uniref:S8 family serine peptidase n=1 Tax=Pseudenhygromyxa sp. WMMC2535 TaxID=2712867 RepID=UPI001552C950|nr:S8 family serine peptidase [Pseudenhygromyxa sp. WMMC2535]NVB40382.1 S8 family serine peptidase [Pseudenhygromyxa sp. WMMC2535]
MNHEHAYALDPTRSSSPRLRLGPHLLCLSLATITWLGCKGDCGIPGLTDSGGDGNSDSNDDGQDDGQDDGPDPAETTGGELEPCEALALAAPIDQLCPTGRVTRECYDDPANLPCGWKQTPLGPQLGAPSIFAKTCVFEFDEAVALELSCDQAPIPDSARDCRVAVLARGAYGPAFEDWLTRDESLPGLPPASADVSVAIVDTLAAHGDLMKAIIDASPDDCGAQAAGAAASCQRRVQLHAGLSQGGGWASEVGVAVEQARRAWQASAPNSKLVINLSLAWERYAADPSAINSPTVYRALRRASCDGALIIAASGNESPYACPRGPMEPAVWETLARPTQQECVAEFGAQSFDAGHFGGRWLACGANEYCPLVHSIGAVDELDDDLANYREGSRPRLATLGFSAQVDSDGPMSGTSVSAAIASGAAARLWSHAPNLSGDAIMQALWSTGRPRSGQLADVSIGAAQGQASAPTQNVLEPCLALQELVAPNLDCAGPLSWAPQTPVAASSPGRAVAISEPPPAETCPSSCNSLQTIENPAVLGSGAPDPWAGPQPSGYPCPPCKIKKVMGQTGASPSDAAAYLELDLDPSLSAQDITGVIITLWDADGTREDHLYTPQELGDPASGDAWTGEAIELEDAALYAVDDASGSQHAPTRAWVEVIFPTHSEGNELILE